MTRARPGPSSGHRARPRALRRARRAHGDHRRRRDLVGRPSRPRCVRRARKAIKAGLRHAQGRARQPAAAHQRADRIENMEARQCAHHPPAPAPSRPTTPVNIAYWDEGRAPSSSRSLDALARQARRTGDERYVAPATSQGMGLDVKAHDASSACAQAAPRTAAECSASRTAFARIGHDRRRARDDAERSAPASRSGAPRHVGGGRRGRRRAATRPCRAAIGRASGRGSAAAATSPSTATSTAGRRPAPAPGRHRASHPPDPARAPPQQPGGGLGAGLAGGLPVAGSWDFRERHAGLRLLADARVASASASCTPTASRRSSAPSWTPPATHRLRRRRRGPRHASRARASGPAMSAPPSRTQALRARPARLGPDGPGLHRQARRLRHRHRRRAARASRSPTASTGYSGTSTTRHHDDGVDLPAENVEPASYGGMTVREALRPGRRREGAALLRRLRRRTCTCSAPRSIAAPFDLDDDAPDYATTLPVLRVPPRARHDGADQRRQGHRQPPHAHRRPTTTRHRRLRAARSPSSSTTRCGRSSRCIAAGRRRLNQLAEPIVDGTLVCWEPGSRRACARHHQRALGHRRRTSSSPGVEVSAVDPHDDDDRRPRSAPRSASPTGAASGRFPGAGRNRKADKKKADARRRDGVDWAPAATPCPSTTSRVTEWGGGDTGPPTQPGLGVLRGDQRSARASPRSRSRCRPGATWPAGSWSCCSPGTSTRRWTCRPSSRASTRPGRPSARRPPRRATSPASGSTAASTGPSPTPRSAWCSSVAPTTTRPWTSSPSWSSLDDVDASRRRGRRVGGGANPPNLAQDGGYGAGDHVRHYAGVVTDGDAITDGPGGGYGSVGEDDDTGLRLRADATDGTNDAEDPATFAAPGALTAWTVRVRGAAATSFGSHRPPGRRGTAATSSRTPRPTRPTGRSWAATSSSRPTRPARC